MAVSTDTIQMLLRQRQQLREALLSLRQEIATLDATSLDLVNRNIKNPPADAAPAPAPHPASAAASGDAPQPAAAPPKTAPAPHPAPATSASAPEAAAQAHPAPHPEPHPAPPSETQRKDPVLTARAAPPPEKEEAAPAPKAPEPAAAEPVAPEHKTTPPPEHHKENAHKEEATGQAQPPEKKAALHDDGNADDDLDSLIGKAQALSDYLLDHPSGVPQAEIGALDAAITVSGAAKTPAEKTACYHTLQAAYRKVAGASFAGTGINGTTLEDSAAGSPLLWTVPLSISLLVFVFFPLLLLARHLAGEMFTDEFANDLTWSIGLMAGFLWGAVGALALLTLNIAVEVRKRRYDGAVRLSPGLRGALGGLIGAAFFALLEIWLPMSDAAADFALDLAAFAGGLFSAVLFAGLQRVISAAVSRLEPAKPKPSAAAKK